jgi:hypothetical protein
MMNKMRSARLGLYLVLLPAASCGYPPLPGLADGGGDRDGTPSDGGPHPPDSPNGAVVTAHWSFSSYANRDQLPTDPCPTGFTTASVHAKEWDPVAGQFVPGGIEVIDKFNCSDKVGTTDPLHGIFLIWVQIESASGAILYAQSESEFFDSVGGDKPIDLPTLFTDAGYMDLSWDLIGSGNTRRSCAQAGIDSNGSISTTVVSVVSPSVTVIDKFICTDGFGASAVLPKDTYNVTVTASNGSGQDLGVSSPIANVKITAPNGLTHLGHVTIPVN